MHAALVQEWGQTPRYLAIPTPPLSSSDSENIQISVTASGLSHVVRSRATGTHYSATTLPHIPGADGTGTTSSGQPVYFNCLQTGGSFCEVINVPKRNVIPLPKGIDPVVAASLVNPGLSSWMALRARCQNLPDGFSVLIMGATSMSGRLAIQLARHLGAKRVIGCARNEAALRELALDDFVTLLDPVETTDFSPLGDVDVILDYVYGPPTVHLLQSLKSSRSVQYVHIGSLAAMDISIPGSVLRSKDLTIRGSGLGSFGARQMRDEIGGLLEAIAGLGEQKMRVCKLSDVEKEWDVKGERMVFVP
ncbi:hypothetical protein MMC06_000547 [Schaereria dolodes]|nr:hypothetical protein [Schaereria dolodes]